VPNGPRAGIDRPSIDMLRPTASLVCPAWKAGRNDRASGQCRYSPMSDCEG
jgi:hypothetical protein